jgi:hypothetical protein
VTLEGDLVGQTTSSRSGSQHPGVLHSRQFRVVAVLAVAVLVIVLARVGAVFSTSDDLLEIKVGNQAVAPLDLRQGAPASPYLFGANVFPATGTTSVDRSSGFMSYGQAVTSGLKGADVKLLRFPGGSWGEEHLTSLDQLDAFSTLLSHTGAQGMIQARISGANDIPSMGTLADRASLAGRWVDYMDNPQSSLRTGAYANAPFYPVTLWAVGNEPDITINPDTKKPFTVDEYVAAFIQFSISMHQNNPTIKVFGPEISQFNGVGIGPVDASGKLWMETFLTDVATYESDHPELKFHLLDGVSFHFYPAPNPHDAATALMTNAASWSYLLGPLRQLVRQSLGRDVPLAVTEINSYTTGTAPAQGYSALWWADTFGELMNQEVEYLAYFSAEGVDSPYPLISSDQLRETSMLRVLQLYAKLQPDVVPLAAQDNPVSIYATQDSAHRTASILFVNKAALPQLAQVRAESQFLGAAAWPSQDISLAAFSITVVVLHRSGGVEAYSYIVPPGAGSAAPPITHTICGQKTDALAFQIPC